MKQIEIKLLGTTIQAEVLPHVTAAEAVRYMKIQFVANYGFNEDVYVRVLLNGHVDTNNPNPDGSFPVYTIYEVYADSGSSDYLTFAHYTHDSDV